MNVTVRWYKNNQLHLTSYYNQSYANGTNFSATLLAENTTKAENWKCGMKTNDKTGYSDWANSTALTILNTPPNAPQLTYPITLNTTHYSDCGNTTRDTFLIKGKRTKIWGSTPQQTVTWNETNITYSFPNINTTRLYKIKLYYYRGDAATSLQNLTAEGTTIHTNIPVNSTGTTKTYDIPASIYQDQDINLTFNLYTGNNATIAEIDIIEYDTVTNLTPTYTWQQPNDNDNDPLNYHIQICTDQDCLTKITDDQNIPTNNYTNKTELTTSSTYYWKTRANDGEEYGNWSDTWNFTLTNQISITLTNPTIDFGIADPDDINDTTNNKPTPFIMENNGNCKTNISIKATTLWTTKPLNTKYLQTKTNTTNTEPGSFNYQKSNTTWTNLTQNYTKLINNLNYTNTNDTAKIDLKIQVPTRESPGTKQTTITFYATRN